MWMAGNSSAADLRRSNWAAAWTENGVMDGDPPEKASFGLAGDVPKIVEVDLAGEAVLFVDRLVDELVDWTVGQLAAEAPLGGEVLWI